MFKFLSQKKLSIIASCLMLSATSIPAHASNFTMHARPPYHIKYSHSTLTPAGLTPAAMRKAYNFPAAYQGAGQVIAIVDLGDSPTIENDLNVFSAQFGLPACTIASGCLSKVSPGGTLPPADPGWVTEIALDVEWAHAIAPLAKIVLVEATDDGYGMYFAIQYAYQHTAATVISLSWGSGENAQEGQLDQYFAESPIPIVACTGDSGNGTWYPSVSPWVVAAGGTQLTLDSNGNYVSETAWSGSGGGLSAFENEPAFQTNYVTPSSTGKRGVPDVAYNASGSTPYAVYDTSGESGWIQMYGTSASAPQWAATIALMKEAKSGNFGYFNQSLYSVARTSGLLNDITTGTNGSCGYYCGARSGYDYVTGVGSPQVTNLVNRFK
jgi:subtilase family serine protease